MNIILSKLIYPPDIVPVVAGKFSHQFKVEVKNVRELAYEIEIAADGSGLNDKQSIGLFFNRLLESAIIEKFGQGKVPDPQN